MFQLNDHEAEWVVSQNVTPHKKYFGGSLPYAFTEQGVAMLSSVLNSTRAVHVNIEIIRAFVRLRNFLSTHEEFKRKLKELENKIEKHDGEISTIFEAIRKLMAPDTKSKKQIGFMS